MLTRPICIDCKHLDWKEYKESGVLRCKAFPELVPYEIMTGQHDHHKPFKGDHGIVFEDASKKELATRYGG